MAASPTASSTRPEPLFALDEIPVPMVFATYRIIRNCNAEFAALFGFVPADLIDQSFSKLYPELADFIRTGQMWQHHLSGGRVYYDERIMAGAGGQRFWCRVNGRSRHGTDPFAEALYCFEPMNRPVIETNITGRQRQILTLVAQGKTNAVIADEIGLSKRTVEAHRLRLMRLIGVRNTAELIAWFAAAYRQASPG